MSSPHILPAPLWLVLLACAPASANNATSPTESSDDGVPMWQIVVAIGSGCLALLLCVYALYVFRRDRRLAAAASVVNPTGIVVASAAMMGGDASKTVAKLKGDASKAGGKMGKDVSKTVDNASNDATNTVLRKLSQLTFRAEQSSAPSATGTTTTTTTNPFNGQNKI